jgi:hypothetical protein
MLRRLCEIVEQHEEPQAEGSVGADTVSGQSGGRGTDDRAPRRVPQMSSARGRDGERTQNKGVKGVIALEPDPEPPEAEAGPVAEAEAEAEADHGPADLLDDPDADEDGDDF